MGRVIRKQGPARVKLNAFIKGMNDYSVRIGWFSTAKYPDGTPTAYVASIHEFGAPSRGIPARSFIRPTIAAQQAAWSQQMRFYAKQIVVGQMNVEQALEGLAIVARGDVDATLARLKDPPLSPLTIYIRKFIKDGGVIHGYKDIMRLRSEMQQEQAKGTLNLSGVSTDPLDFTGYMRATLSYTVTKEKS
ncbi:tail completion or Neck1 protein [Burkholderia phage BcepB1A]|uniref:tail completion or Neck1 protein n=1 Tax=Burkholderia phage BcepB1A TaxID=279530 RepID=UPI0000377991|nr:tail completion or Neck1 protein [Burkholderia phage BcepB1A]AAT37726.1 gp20 [Burkholderia phage BcepB1A]